MNRSLIQGWDTANLNRRAHQVSGGASYDANGNQLTSTPATLSWNALNQPITVNSTTATYDALGRMVEKGAGGAYTQFVFRPSGAMLAEYSGGLVKGTIPLPGGSTAVYNASGVNYIRHKDWLGSSRLATTWAHGVYSKEAYAPFGETYNEAGTPDRSFTGQDQDTVPAVNDFLFRKFDPAAGRWLSPDPYGWNAVDLTNPQSLNRNAYVMNQAMSFTDPLGLTPMIGICQKNWWTTTTTYPDGTTSTSNSDPWYTNCTVAPPSGCIYIFNATGSYQGMACQGSVANYAAQPPTGGGGSGAPNNGSDMKYNIFNCPDGHGHDPCANTWIQSNCVVSKPLENAVNSTVKGAVGTAFKAGVSNGAGWSGFLPAAWNAVKTGTVTAGAAFWTYANIIYDTARYTVNGCTP